MKRLSNNRQAVKRGLVGLILVLAVLGIVGISLLGTRVSVIHAYNEEGELLIAEQVNAETTLESRYIHSVARCPMIEKFEVNDKQEIVLMESWNCSFGAGIEAETPEGATNRMEDGYFVYDHINKPFSELSFRAVPINEQILKIDDQTWDFSQTPFLDETITLQIIEERRLFYWWGQFQVP